MSLLFPAASWQALHLPKRGHSDDEYEDAFAADPEAGRFAVADGATESSFAGPWARLLVERFVAGDEAGWLGSSRAAWAAEVDGRPLPWYAEAKRAEGAFATFLGLVLAREAGGWRALAVGDACLFLVRDDRLARAFPLGRPEDFGNQPRLLGSRADPHPPAPDETRGDWRPGDLFLLATDALAEWFLRRTRAGGRPWHDLDGLSGEAFADWVERRREQEGLRNDDVTVVAIRT
jgi:hypothetical protein